MTLHYSPPPPSIPHAARCKTSLFHRHATSVLFHLRAKPATSPMPPETSPRPRCPSPLRNGKQCPGRRSTTRPPQLPPYKKKTPPRSLSLDWGSTNPRPPP